MLLQHLRNFEWYNEPLGVFFIDAGMKVVANPETDFVQNKKHGISIDTGHFFYIEKEEDFHLKLNWSSEINYPFAQCGLMLRENAENWAKIFSSQDKNGKTNLNICVSNQGNQDESYIEVPTSKGLFYKIEMKEDEFILSYSFDETTYFKVRKFSFINSSKKIKVGAYICNPQNADFEAILTHLDVSN